MIEGACVDEAMLAGLAVELLRGYQAFRAETLGRLISSRMIHSVGNSEVELDLAGKKVTLKSVAESAAFWAEVNAALQKA